MIVSWRPDPLRQTLILRRRFQHRARIELSHAAALNLLPRRLMRRHRIAAGLFQLATP